MQLQVTSIILHSKSIILLIMIWIVNTFHKHFSVINLGGECRQYQSFNVCTIRNTLTHCGQIFVLVYLTPIHTPLERTLQHEVKPYSSTATITLHKRMSTFLYEGHHFMQWGNKHSELREYHQSHVRTQTRDEPFSWRQENGQQRNSQHWHKPS